MKKLNDWLNGKKRNISIVILAIFSALGFFGVADLPKISEQDITEHLDKIAAAITYLGGVVLGIVGVIHDITKKLKAKKNG